eukprot:921871-Pelagomonas_calceolata.AAC.1
MKYMPGLQLPEWGRGWYQASSRGVEDIRRVKGGACGLRAGHCVHLCVGTTAGLRTVPQASACGQQLHLADHADTACF